PDVCSAALRGPSPAGRPPPRVPGVARRPPRRAGRTGARLRTSRGPAPARKSPPALMAFISLAIDVGGTKITVGLADPDDALVHTATQPTPHVDAEAVCSVAERLI